MQHLLTSRHSRRKYAAIFAGLICVFLSLIPTSSISATPGTIAKRYQQIGTIKIPTLHLNSPIFLGITNAVFDRGVGQWPGSAKPGKAGNVVLGAHRTSKPRPFRNINKLRSGDVILISVGKKTFKYVVTGHAIVKPKSVWITDETRTATLTLFSCHPIGSVTSRYVVRAVLVK